MTYYDILTQTRNKLIEIKHAVEQLDCNTFFIILEIDEQIKRLDERINKLQI